MHAAVTAWDALECLRNETAMVLLATAQAVDLRGGGAKLGEGSGGFRERAVGGGVSGQRPCHGTGVALVAGKIAMGATEERASRSRLAVSQLSHRIARAVQYRFSGPVLPGVFQPLRPVLC